MNGQYHWLDYNKVTPNNEDGQYIFTISSSEPTQAPIADFSYTISGNTVYFQDQSANTPTSWQWNFGDGQSSTQANVSHTYTNGGLYNVTLTVSNLYGSSSKTKQVSISNIPQYVTVSGRVEDENFNTHAGATVSCCTEAPQLIPMVIIAYRYHIMRAIVGL
jgi:PKD repeat protein